MVTFVAVPFQLYSLTGSTLQVGLLSICDAVPPSCPPGQTAESNGSCYTGFCIPATVCGP